MEKNPIQRKSGFTKKRKKFCEWDFMPGKKKNLLIGKSRKSHSRNYILHEKQTFNQVYITVILPKQGIEHMLCCNVGTMWYVGIMWYCLYYVVS